MTHDKNSITFLDVRLYVDASRHLCSTLFRKSTAGNTILHADSSHPLSLKNSIPFGQYLRLRRNCSNDVLFLEEAGKLQDRLLCRGYSRKCLRKAYNKTKLLPRHTLLHKKKMPNLDSDVTRIILRFSRQHKSIQDIFSKNWTILTDDPKIKPLISDNPSITFRCATSIKDRLVSSEYRDITIKNKHCPVRGTFPCGHCSHCPLIKKAKVFQLPNGDPFKPLHFSNCQTQGIVYLMECECGAFYVGKTKQQLWRRMAKHVYSMEIGNLYLPIGRHTVTHHNYIVPKVSFTALYRIHIPNRGGDWNKILLQHEQCWIFRLQATIFPGLNESISFAPFLKGFVSGKTQ